MKQDIDIWKEDLLKAGWTPKTSTIWIAPDGSHHRGPCGAWCRMQANRIIAHLQTDEGIEEVRQSILRSEAFAERLRKMTKVSWDELHEPFTI